MYGVRETVWEQWGQYIVDNVPWRGMQRGIPEASRAFFDGVGGFRISGGGEEGVEEEEEVIGDPAWMSERRGERRRGFGVSSGSGSDFACVGRSGEGDGEAVVTCEADLDFVGEVRRLLRSRERSPSPYDNPTFSSNPSIFLFQQQ